MMFKKLIYRYAVLASCLLFISIEDIAQELQLNDTESVYSDSLNSGEPESFNVMPISLNKKMVSFVKSYLKEYDRTLSAAKKRSEPIFAIMDSIFEMNDIPVQLKYMAVVESNLKASVRSKAGASGIWQFMPATAKTFGLMFTNKYDERLQVNKSTLAAARYMKMLYAEFGDWLLVIAAYNAGSGRVKHAIRISGSRDFWRLQNFLPAETRNHVKRFIGVHYYFEGQGGETTLTKEETKQYRKDLAVVLIDTEATNLTLKEEVSKTN